MRPDQDLTDITSGVLKGMKGVLDDFTPDFVIVQGDTTTAFVVTLDDATSPTDAKRV